MDGISAPDNGQGDDFLDDKIKKLDAEILKDSRRLDDAVRDSVYGDQGNRFHPEYDGDYLEALEESTAWTNLRLGPWDLLVPESEREGIARLVDLGNPRCPYFGRPHDKESSLFYFCTPEAEVIAGPKASLVGHPLKKASVTSAENAARCNLGTIGKLCMGNFRRCTVYQAEQNGESKDLKD